jgi:hypothetical protein
MQTINRYPDWQYQPVRLSVEEMENPYEVLDQFFDCYSLPGLRSNLRQWLKEALTNKEGGSGDTLLLHDDIEKLIEVAWVIHQQNEVSGIASEFLLEAPVRI